MGRFAVRLDGHVFEVEIPERPGFEEAVEVFVDGEPLRVVVPDPEAPFDRLEWLLVGDRPIEVHFDAELRWVRAFDGVWPLEVRDLETPVARPTSGDGRVKAPIPGQIVRVLVETGQHVESGQPLLVLEAMKMENEILAPRAGTVAELHVREGQGVTLHELMLEIS